MKKIVHNFSTYNLSQEKINALPYGLYHYVYININSIVTEFEFFYQKFLKDISNMTETGVNKIKKKLRNTCENF